MNAPLTADGPVAPRGSAPADSLVALCSDVLLRDWCVLFDFDGPLADLFAAPRWSVSGRRRTVRATRDLRRVLRRHGVSAPPLDDPHDPHELFRRTLDGLAPAATRTFPAGSGTFPAATDTFPAGSRSGERPAEVREAGAREHRVREAAAGRTDGARPGARPDGVRLGERPAGPLRDALHARLDTQERRAARTARPTPGAAETVRLLHGLGLRLAVTSNNAEAAVRAYLRRARLLGCFLERGSPGAGATSAAGGPAAVIVGRDGDHRRMKPEPYCLERAMERHGAVPAASLLIGDATTDVKAARAAGVAVCGYGPTEDKARALRDAGADVVVTHMSQLTAALAEARARVTRPVSAGG
ncbi:HAD family hydrolase [Streptomyces lycii]|uniref:HAD family hydrolase n=1 Tax=Streptomyces lycii TaxID=2654337 RepID=A0ABQ7FGP2_9ACTN|nr:HAD hydrolase-like protein [Streptomyces lycii]KAF4407128.1 HAD family hydrolase [Streptomyces lycii]